MAGTSTSNSERSHPVSNSWLRNQDSRSATPPDWVTTSSSTMYDAEYKLLMSAGLQPVMPLEDHPWGDRGFAVQDPNGVALYIYSEREPSPEFKQYYKT
ncbi:MAG: VOC family protein [Nitrosomonas sp.]